MAREDVAVVCALVLLLRLGRFLEPDGLAELRPLFRVSVCTFGRLPFPANLAAGSPYIPMYVKAFQWRFCNKLSSDLLRDTGFALSTATAKKGPKHIFQTRHPSEKTIRDICPGLINRHAAEAK